MGWMDVHCHLQVLPEPELAAVLTRAGVFGVDAFAVNGTRPEDWGAVAALAGREGVRPQFGLHPWFAEAAAGWEAELTALLLRFPQAGVGEIGLDSKLTETPMAVQEAVLARQLALAARLGRVCTLHAVGDVWAALLASVRAARPPRVLLHAWGGGAGRVGDWVALGGWFSFGGAVCRERVGAGLRAAVRAVPADRLLLETDCPWQHPEGRALRSEPAMLLRVAGAVAEIREISVEALLRQTHENAMAFFAGQLGVTDA